MCRETRIYDPREEGTADTLTRMRCVAGQWRIFSTMIVVEGVAGELDEEGEVLQSCLP